MRSRQWLDGHLMQQPGYTDNGQGHGKFVARAADEEYEAGAHCVRRAERHGRSIEVWGLDARC